MSKTRPGHGTKRRWRDLVSQDLKTMGAKDTWYKRYHEVKEWWDLCQEGVDKTTANRGKKRCAADIPSQGKRNVSECGRTL